MLLTFLTPWASIREPVISGEIADLVVLTGINGGGKSNLLQAIANGNITVDGMATVTPQPPTQVRLFRLSELITQAEGAQSPAQYRERYIQLYQVVRSLNEQYPTAFWGAPSGTSIEVAIREQLVQQNQIGAAALLEAERLAGKALHAMSAEDFKQYAPLLIGVRDPFGLSITEIFLSYHARRNSNDQDQWLAESKGRKDVFYLSDERFAEVNGPPPWELLDATLRVTGMPYTFIPPEGTAQDLPYEAMLLHHPDEVRVRVDQLSSGERTLLAIAFSLYSGAQLETIAKMPPVLLLDEVDASLHPSMVHSLLRVVDEIFVGQHCVKVIMTTHSPTTVALAPEESLYVMRRDDRPRLAKASRDVALASLTVGLPTLSVKFENRRQVFVESKHDESWYQSLFDKVRGDLNSPYSLSFLAAAKERGANSTAVVSLVNELRSAGNTSIWGLVDRDERKSAPPWVVYNDTRYAIENLVLDPLLVGIYLIRTRALTGAQAGLADDIRHFDIGPDHAQALINHVTIRVAATGDDMALRNLPYNGGFSANIPAFWLDTQGHALEARIKEAFPNLRAWDKSLITRVIEDAMTDVPGAIPKDLLEIFRRLLT